MVKRIASHSVALLAGLAVGFAFGEWIEDTIIRAAARWQ